MGERRVREGKNVGGGRKDGKERKGMGYDGREGREGRSR